MILYLHNGDKIKTENTSKTPLDTIQNLPPSEQYIAGIDESGRGPVLGPMVYCICFGKAKDIDSLTKNDYKDSKTLTQPHRASLFDKIKRSSTLEFLLDSISPVVISTLMNRRPKVNLNQIARDSTFGLISKVLKRNIPLKRVFVDTIGPAAKYEQLLKNKFQGVDFVVREKADSLFPIVSAASICAKEARDEALRLSAKEIGLNDVGSGYPSDPKTKRFLKESYDPLKGFPDIVRTSWETAKKIVREHSSSKGKTKQRKIFKAKKQVIRRVITKRNLSKK